MLHCGMDLHARSITVHVLDGAGKQVVRGTFGTSEDELGAFCRGLTKLASIYVEAGTASAWAARIIEANGHRPVVVDPNRNRLISHSAKKTDRNDAATLAAMGRVGMLQAVHVRRVETDRVRRTLTARSALVQARGDLIRVVRAMHRAEGELLPGCEGEDFARRIKSVWGIHPDRAEAVLPLVETIEAIQGQIDVAEGAIDAHVKDNRALVERLTRVPGVGNLTAIAFLAHVEDPRRFKNTSQVAAYLGLVPWVQESGGHRRDGHITKHGSKTIRNLLVQAAWSHLRSREDSALQRWGRALKDRVGGKKAVAAVARKLGELLWTLWRKETAYQPFPPSSRRQPSP